MCCRLVNRRAGHRVWRGTFPLTRSLSPPSLLLSPPPPRLLFPPSPQVDRSKVKDVIGQGGKVIKGIKEEAGLESIDIDDSGMVSGACRGMALREEGGCKGLIV